MKRKGTKKKSKVGGGASKPVNRKGTLSSRPSSMSRKSVKRSSKYVSTTSGQPKISSKRTVGAEKLLSKKKSKSAKTVVKPTFIEVVSAANKIPAPPTSDLFAPSHTRMLQATDVRVIIGTDKGVTQTLFNTWIKVFLAFTYEDEDNFLKEYGFIPKYNKLNSSGILSGGGRSMRRLPKLIPENRGRAEKSRSEYEAQKQAAMESSKLRSKDFVPPPDPSLIIARKKREKEQENLWLEWAKWANNVTESLPYRTDDNKLNKDYDTDWEKYIKLEDSLQHICHYYLHGYNDILTFIKENALNGTQIVDKIIRFINTIDLKVNQVILEEETHDLKGSERYNFERYKKAYEELKSEFGVSPEDDDYGYPEAGGTYYDESKFIYKAGRCGANIKGEPNKSTQRRPNSGCCKDKDFVEATTDFVKKIFIATGPFKFFKNTPWIFKSTVKEKWEQSITSGLPVYVKKQVYP